MKKSRYSTRPAVECVCNEKKSRCSTRPAVECVCNVKKPHYSNGPAEGVQPFRGLRANSPKFSP